jgi:hypothetical protein
VLQVSNNGAHHSECRRYGIYKLAEKPGATPKLLGAKRGARGKALTPSGVLMKNAGIKLDIYTYSGV